MTKRSPALAASKNRVPLLTVAILATLAISLPLPARAADDAAPDQESESGVDFTLENLAGKSVTLRDFLKDGPVMVNFWATWCKPCLKELPYMEELQKTYRDQGLTVLAISEDNARSVGKVKTYIQSTGYTFTVLLDTNGEAKRRLKAWATPYTVLFDSDGSKAYAHVGYRPGDEKELAKQVKALMDRRAAGNAGE